MLPGWTRHTVANTQVDTFEPPRPRSYLLVWLHDIDCRSPALHPQLTAEFLKRRLRCISPDTGPTWWVNRQHPTFDQNLTPEEFLREQIIIPQTKKLPAGGRSLALAGAGMGGHGSLRFAFRYPNLAPVVGSLDGQLDFQDHYGRGNVLDELYPSREHCRQDSAILHIHPSNWPTQIWFGCSPSSSALRGNDRLHEKLQALGVPHQAELETTSANLVSLLDFLCAALDRESRRLA